LQTRRHASAIPEGTNCRLPGPFTGAGYDKLRAPLTRLQGRGQPGQGGQALYDYEAGQSRDCLETDLEPRLLVSDHLKNFTSDVCDLFYHAEMVGKEPSGVPFMYDAPELRSAFLRRWLAGRADPSIRMLPIEWRNYNETHGRLALLAHMVRDGVAPLEERIAAKHGYAWINPLSPLQYQPEEATALLRLDDHPEENYRLVIISPEIMIGATSPVTMGGALAQHNAEILAGVVLTQLVHPGMPMMYGCIGAVMDLRNAQVSHGNFETALFHVAGAQMADYYGMPSRVGPGNTSEKKPGVRAAVETAVGLCLGIACGGNLIMSGTLDSTLMLNYEHLLVTDEIIGQLKSIGSGVRTDAESLALEVIETYGHPSPEYLTSDHTLAMMSRDIYYSDFCGRIESSYEDWYEKAHRKVRGILAMQQDEITDSSMIQRLAAVEARLAEDDRTWRTGRGDWWRSYVQDIA
jgi:hypothetical protein